MRKICCAALAVLGAWGAVLASSAHAEIVAVTVPSSAATTEGNNNSVVPYINGARTNQYQVTNAAMGGLAVGSVIQGVSFRVDGGTAGGPITGVSWTDYEITFARAANAINSMSATLASNMVSPVLVKDGLFSLPVNSLPGTGTPRDFGGTITFDIPYTYQGGDLVILLTHTGGVGTGPTVDGIQTDTSGTGGIRALSTAVTFQNPTADNMAFRMPVMQLVVAVPETSAWLLVGVVAVGACVVLCVRRRSARAA